ncbi:response regulator [Thioclava sp. FR2]|uniref:response regulator n=1 Tax=Thioclava sp. FR2 TaxID=3445780 RepID=UPI003EB9E6FE
MGIASVRGKGQADAGTAINAILAVLSVNAERSGLAGGAPMPMGNGTGGLGLQAAVQGMLVPERGALPLSGVTILLVEDSRFTSDALRLMCQRSGARMRRAETIAAARAHLKTYRPDVVIVDLGLPDGKGEDLIAEFAGQGMVVIATSGDPAGALSSRRAGACRFWAKPLPGLAVFQGDVLSHLPSRFKVVSADKEKAEADPMALADDLRHALAVLEEPDSADQRHYLAGFLQGLARSTGDATLREAARLLDKTGASLAPVQAALSARLNAAGVI